jgi:predicted nucleic acid-binding protein
VTERVVLDASVAIARLRKEEGSDTVRRALRTWAAAGTVLFVPSMLWVEVLNALVRRHSWDAAAVAEGFLVLDGLGITTVEVDRPLLLLAASEMEMYGLSGYDAVYLALALAMDARLATLDDRLAHAAGDRAVHVGGGRRSISEPHVPYARPAALAAWAHSAIVGAHLAELRAQVLRSEGPPD